MKSIQCCRVYRLNRNVRAEVGPMDLSELSAGDVTIRARYSSLNYKDALAVTGEGPILRRSPLNAGIDVAGEVAESKDPGFEAGQKVLVTGCGLGENHDGGFSQLVRVPGEWVIPLPSSDSNLFQAMALGTAGFTAALAVFRMQSNGQDPDKGPILVTGASGGVGCLAVQILSKLGFNVMAVSQKTSKHPILKKWGATQTFTPDELNLGKRPLESSRFAGAIDNVGGELLSGILPHIQHWGNVASIGLTGGSELNTTVMPFILRGVSLLGISSANCPTVLRRNLWNLLFSDWLPPHWEETVSKTIGLEQIVPTAQKMLARETFGRILVKID